MRMDKWASNSQYKLLDLSEPLLHHTFQDMMEFMRGPRGNWGWSRDLIVQFCPKCLERKESKALIFMEEEMNFK